MLLCPELSWPPLGGEQPNAAEVLYRERGREGECSASSFLHETSTLDRALVWESWSMALSSESIT